MGILKTTSYPAKRKIILASEDSVALTIALTSEVFKEWSSIDSSDFEFELCSPKDTLLVITKVSSIVRNLRLNQDTLYLSLFIDKLTPKPPKLLRICLRPKRIPDWIKHQDCESLSVQSNCTVKLKDFVEDIIRSITSPYTIVSIKINVEQK